MVQIQDSLRRLESMQVHPATPSRVRETLEDAMRQSGAAEPESAGELSFGSMLRDGVQSVSDAGKNVETKMKGLITGETESVHDVLSAMGKSEVQFSLMLQVRNKLIDAWQRLSQIRV